MAKAKVEPNYPDLPAGQNKFTMSEACLLCNSKPHVLRYLENQIGKLANVERRNGRRYYSPENIHTIRRVVSLRSQGMTIEGVDKILSSRSGRPVASAAPLDLPRLRAEMREVIKLLS